jgi:hypothetical protein
MLRFFLAFLSFMFPLMIIKLPNVTYAKYSPESQTALIRHLSQVFADL